MGIYEGFKSIAAADFDWENDTIKAILVTDAQNEDYSAHEVYDDITEEVADGNGYTTGGVELDNTTVDQNGEYSIYDADDISWLNSTITARAVVIYRDTGDSATSELIAYMTFGGNVSSDNSTFVVAWSDDGVFTVS